MFRVIVWELHDQNFPPSMFFFDSSSRREESAKRYRIMINPSVVFNASSVSPFSKSSSIKRYALYHETHQLNPLNHKLFTMIKIANSDDLNTGSYSSTIEVCLLLPQSLNPSQPPLA